MGVMLYRYNSYIMTLTLFVGEKITGKKKNCFPNIKSCVEQKTQFFKTYFSHELKVWDSIYRGSIEKYNFSETLVVNVLDR